LCGSGSVRAQQASASGSYARGVTDRPTDDPGALRRALDEALAELGEPAGGDPPDADGTRWLRAGLRIGLGRPALAGSLLELTAPGPGDGTGVAGPPDADEAAPAPALAAVSSLLARSATMPAAQRREVGRDVAFGWATRLRAADVLALGQAVQRQLAGGASPDLGKAFAIAWDDGVRIPVDERDGLLSDFVALQEAVGSALAGRDIREPEPGAAPLGLAGIVDRWVRGARPERSPAAAKIHEAGEAGRLGLIAAWNAWAALRYRSQVPPPTFALLVEPWESVVAPFEDAPAG
jgi:hypothetical protein